MAQPSSIQREPSMEEILASIRRIIEDSDTTKETPPGGLDPKPRTFASAVELGSETANLAEVDRFRGEIDEQTADGGPASPSDHEGEGEAEFGMRSQTATIQPFPALSAAAARQTAPSQELADDIDTGANHAVALNGHEAPLQAPRAGLDAMRSGEPADAVAGQAIISEKAGRQVAAAFEELSEAFAANRRRSFDEMAEEMLRPMLREWMDNNLPLLVERLVREEIERVARGS